MWPAPACCDWRRGLAQKREARDRRAAAPKAQSRWRIDQRHRFSVGACVTLRLVAFAFDPSQPGAVRLRELALRIRDDFTPTNVEILEPVIIDDRSLTAGERVALPARSARALVDSRAARRIDV
jgi:hypothetical protein